MMSSLWSDLWWIVPLAWVAVVAVMVVEVRYDPVFGVASPYMNAIDAWEVAFYLHTARLNKRAVGDRRPPEDAGMIARTNWTIAITASMGFLAFAKIAYGKYNEKNKKVAESYKQSTDVATWSDTTVTEGMKQNAMKAAVVTAEAGPGLDVLVAKRTAAYNSIFDCKQRGPPECTREEERARISIFDDLEKAVTEAATAAEAAAEE